MTFQQFRYLIEISKHHSISKAATALFVTQPSISKAIRDLEEELHITILNRTNKGVVFTKEGRELLTYATMVIEQTDAIQHHFNKTSTVQERRFSISSQHFGFAAEALVQTIHDAADEPFEFALREGKSQDVIEDVYMGKSTIGLLSVSASNKQYFERYFREKSLQFTSIATIPQHVFLRKEHPLASFHTLTYEQLKSYPYLSYQQEDPMLHFAEDHLRIYDLNQLVYVTDRGTMNNLLSKTDGYNIGTGCIVKGFMDDNITSVPLAEKTMNDIGFLQRQDVFLTHHITNFLENIATALKRSMP